MTGARMTGIGMAVPESARGNDEVAAVLGLDPSWIEERTGIRTRRVVSGAETASTLGIAAARRALESAQAEGSDIDMVVCATITPDLLFPALACTMQHAIGASGAAFDLNAGCSGFLYALAQADAAVRAGAARRVLVAGVDVLSRITDPHDPKTAPLFGDGAGAAVVEASEDGYEFGPFALHADGSRPDLLFVPPETGTIRMEGREVYRWAVEKMAAAVQEVLRSTRTPLDAVDLVVAHQANERILQAVAARLGLPAAKMYSNIARYGNTSAASIPIALAEAAATGVLRRGDLVVLAAFGAGFTWGASLMRWAVRGGGRVGSPEVVRTHV